MSRALLIAARLVAAAGICFISLFALDAFGTGLTSAEIAMALLMHLLPSAMLIGVLVLAWRWPLAGGLIYLALAALPFALLSNPPLVNLALAAPFALAGLLSIAGAVSRTRPQSPTGRSGSR